MRKIVSSLVIGSLCMFLLTGTAFATGKGISETDMMGCHEGHRIFTRNNLQTGKVVLKVHYIDSDMSYSLTPADTVMMLENFGTTVHFTDEHHCENHQ